MLMVIILSIYIILKENIYIYALITRFQHALHSMLCLKIILAEMTFKIGHLLNLIAHLHHY